MRAASMQRMGRRRLPPAKVVWRMARWMEWGCGGGGGEQALEGGVGEGGAGVEEVFYV